MKNDILILADDFSDQSLAGRARSGILRKYGVLAAQALNLQVEIIFVNSTPKKYWTAKKIKSKNQETLKVESAALEYFNKNSIQANVIHRFGSPAEEILLHLENRRNVKLVLIGTKGRTGIKNLVLGSVAEEVLRNIRLPTIIIGPEAMKSKTFSQLGSKTKTLLLSDFSKSAIRAEKFAMNLIKDLNCHLTFLNCLGDKIFKTRMSLYSSGYVPLNLDQIFLDMKKQSSIGLKKRNVLWKKNEVNITAQISTSEEPIEHTFDKKMKDKFDLVVMGTHGRSPIMKAFIGSATRKIILRSPIPVIIVPN
jgi:nucleotide-binding universal stress UspA family protein